MKRCAGLGEIVQPLAGGFVVDHRAHRHLHVDRCAFRAGAVAAFAVPSALGFMFGIEAELQQGVLVLAGDQDDVAAAAAIAAAGAAARDVLLAAEGQAAVAAVAGLDQDS